MKQVNSIKLALIVIMALTVASFVTGCATTPPPQLGEPTALQVTLNELAPVSVAGKNMKFQFGGDRWIATVDGKDFSAGTFVSEDNAKGSILTLTQTHLYNEKLGWSEIPAPAIVLDYKKGPPKSLSLKK